MNSISKFIWLFVFVFSAGAFLFATVPQAAAAPFIVGNNYHEIISKNCLSITLCELNTFTGVPTGKTVTLNRTSCRIDITPTTVVINDFALWRQFGIQNFAAQYLGPIQAHAPGKYQVNADVNVALPAGYSPRVRLKTESSASLIVLVCSVAGTITP